MSKKRLLGMGFLGIILLIALLTSNLLIATDRTVLNDEFVKESASEAALYEYVHTQIGAQLVPDTPSTPGSVPINFTEERVMTQIVTQDYVTGQVNENIEGTYRYLHGENDEVTLLIDTEPVKGNFRYELSEEMKDITLADVGFEQLAQWKASEEAYQNEMQERREALRNQIQEETDEELTEEEIDAIMEDRKDEFREQIATQFVNNVPEDRIPPGGNEAVRAMGVTIAEAVLNEQSHDEFVAGMNATEDSLRNAMVDEVMIRVDGEVPDQVNVAGQASQGALAPLETGREIVNIVGLLQWVLPILSILLIGGIVWIAPRYSSAAFEIGAVAVSIGLGGVIGAQVVPSEVRRVVAAQDIPQGLADFIIAIITNMSEIIMQQSVILLGIGVLVLVVGIVIRFRLLFADVLDDKAID